MDFRFSILQLHSIIRLTSPIEGPGFPLRRRNFVRFPNSRDSVEPYPRHTCDTRLPRKAPKKRVGRFGMAANEAVEKALNQP